MVWAYGWRSQLPCVASSSAAEPDVPGQPVLGSVESNSVTGVRASSVALLPSTRTDTVGAATADAASARARRRPATPARRTECKRATPFHEGCSAFRSEAGLLAPGSDLVAPSRAALRHSDVVRRASPVTVAGPRRIHTGFPWPPTRVVGGDVTVKRAQ